MIYSSTPPRSRTCTPLAGRFPRHLSPAGAAAAHLGDLQLPRCTLHGAAHEPILHDAAATTNDGGRERREATKTHTRSPYSYRCSDELDEGGLKRTFGTCQPPCLDSRMCEPAVCASRVHLEVRSPPPHVTPTSAGNSSAANSESERRKIQEASRGGVAVRARAGMMLTGALIRPHSSRLSWIRSQESSRACAFVPAHSMPRRPSHLLRRLLALGRRRDCSGVEGVALARA